MTLCATGCGRPKRAGRGMRLCDPCKVVAEEQRRCDAVRRTREWNAANGDRKKAAAKAYYERTADRQREKTRAWYRANPEKVQAHRERERALKRPRVRRYGISVDDYKRMLAEQTGACAICGATEPGRRDQHNLDVDHDHVTGVVRGLLCNRCNRLLANALDDPELLLSAISYLERNAS